jgi:DNA-binding response OmpR family regulator
MERNKFKILIIEDDNISSIAIEMYVQSLGYIVTDIVSNANDTLKSMIQNQADIVISDIKLKDSINGTQICNKLYQKYQIPIIFLSAYCDDLFLEEAQKSNPIGYLTKPFREDELKALLKLSSLKILEEEKYIISKNNFYFNIKNSKLYRDKCLQKEIKLTSHEEKLLSILIDNSPSVVTYETIINILWDSNTKSDDEIKDRIRTLIKSIRKKTYNKFITTVIKEGLKFEL